MPKQTKHRVHYPEAETKYGWLGMLLDAYFIVDGGIREEIKREEGKRGGPKVACKKGCSGCCYKQEVPLSEIETLGISWYSCEQLVGELRNNVKQQLLFHHRAGAQCPFLVCDSCAIYPVRPLACRMFIVIGEASSNGEDPFTSRWHDMLHLSPSVARKAMEKILPFWNFCSQAEKDAAIESDFVVKESNKVMSRGDWARLCRVMSMFENDGNRI